MFCSIISRLEDIEQNISSAGLIAMRLCRLNYSTMALDCNYASTQATFFMLLFANFLGYSTMIVLLALNIYILNSNKNKQQNVIAYLYVALFLFNMKKYILIQKKWLVLMYSCLQPNKWFGGEIVRYFCVWKCLSLEVKTVARKKNINLFPEKTAIFIGQCLLPRKHSECRILNLFLFLWTLLAMCTALCRAPGLVRGKKD